MSRRAPAVLCAALALALAPAAAALAPASASAAADLKVTLEDTPDPAIPGDTITETATVTNQGDVTATLVSVSFSLLDDVTLAGAPGCISFIEILAVCEIGTLPPGSSAQRAITIGGILQPGTVSVRATGTHELSDPTPDDNQMTAVTTIEPRADLKLQLAAPDFVIVGGTLTETATVRNTGAGPARSTVLRLTLPPELTVASLPAGCTATALQAVCDLGTLASQASVTRAIVLSAPAEGTFTILGGVTWARADPTPVDTLATTTTTAAPPPEPATAATPAPPAPRTVALATLVRGLPRAGGCVRGRSLRLRLRAPAGAAISKADVIVAGRRVRRLEGSATKTAFAVRGLPRDRFTLRLTVTLLDGRRLQGSRVLRACRARARRSSRFSAS